jgi:hypothetical protein
MAEPLLTRSSGFPMTKLALLLVAIAACKGEPSSLTTTSTASGSTAAPITPIASDAAAPAVVVDAAAIIDASACRPMCLYAAESPLADAIAKHAADCKADWYAAGDCEGLLYARNCIYAAYGNVFKTAAWKDRFTNEPWYKPNPKFVEKDIPAFAMANIKELKKQYQACAAPVPAVTPEDKKLAADTYERVIMKEESADGIDLADLSDARSNHRNLAITDKTTYAYDAAPKDGRRMITLTGLYHTVGGGEFKSDESASLTFEGTKLVEIR